MKMKMGPAKSLLLLAFLAAVFLAVGISFAQTSQPVCTSDHCDSNIVTVTTQSGTGNGLINLRTYVGNQLVTSGPCTASITSDSGSGDTGSCVRLNVSKAPGTYHAFWLGSYPNGADPAKPPIYDPASVTLLAGETQDLYIYFAKAGVNTGTINVKTKVKGIFLTDPSSQNGTCQVDVLPGYSAGPCIRTISNASPGTYSLSNLTGLPTGATSAQTPILSSSQVLSAGGSIDLVIDFPAPAAAYTLSCAAKDDKSISVLWSGNIPTSHTIQLYGANSTITTPVSSGSIYGPVNGPGNYSFIDGNLAPGAHRWYAMKTTDNLGAVTWSNVVDCKPSVTVAPFADVPTDLHVDGWDRNSINVTWMDNVTTNRAHHFEVQRINATPLRSTNFIGVSRSSAAVSFSWKNSTGYVLYNSVLERSTSTNSITRFSKSDISMVSLPPIQEYDPFISGNLAGNPVSFSYTDSGVGEATVYYYQLKACFPDSVTSFYTPAKAGGTVNPKPDRACSGYVPGGTSALATTTLPNTPSNLVVTSTSPSAIAVSWKDNSAKEEGFYIYRNGAYIATVNASAGTGVALSYNDTGLSSGTSYTYTVKSFFTDPLTGMRLLSNTSNSATAITWVTLTVSNSPTSGGSVSGTGINCGATCSKVFKVGGSVTLTASPAASYDFSGWTGDFCSGATGVTCAFTINRDTSIGAVFTYIPPDLCPNVTGVQTTTPCADVTCTTSGETWNVSTQTCTPAPTDLCLNVNGIQTTTPCADTLCVAPTTWNVSTQTCVRPPLGDYSGDVNGDGFITCADVNMINQFVTNGNTGLSPTQQKWADVSGNGTVSAYDVALLTQRYNLSCPGAFLAPTDAVVASLSGAVGVAKDTISGWWSDLVSTLKSGWNAVAGIFNSIGVNKAEAVAENVYNNYFGLKKLSADMTSHLYDIGLVEDSVYIYRVRVVYDDGGPTATSNWSVKAAGKTLGATAPPPDDGSAPVIYSGLTASGQVTKPFSYSIKASNIPTSYGASGLPAGLRVDASTGVITGTPSVPTSGSNVTISASNANGTGSKTLVITIFGDGGCSGSGCCVGGDCGGGGGGGICVGNNLCDKSMPSTQVTDGTGLLLEQSEVQCRVNADCADVGRYSKTFQEQ